MEVFFFSSLLFSYIRERLNVVRQKMCSRKSFFPVMRRWKITVVLVCNKVETKCRRCLGGKDGRGERGKSGIGWERWKRNWGCAVRKEVESCPGVSYKLGKVSQWTLTGPLVSWIAEACVYVWVWSKYCPLVMSTSGLEVSLLQVLMQPPASHQKRLSSRLYLYHVYTLFSPVHEIQTLYCKLNFTYISQC